MRLLATLLNAPVLQKSRGWFDDRSGREQILLTGLGAIGVSALFAIAVWRPLAEHRSGALSEIMRYDAVLAQARAAGSGLRAEAITAAPPASVADTAAGHGLLIRRIEPDGATTRIAFEDVRFANVIDWIADVEQAGMFRLASIEIERRPSPGVVNVQVTLEDQN